MPYSDDDDNDYRKTRRRDDFDDDRRRSGMSQQQQPSSYYSSNQSSYRNAQPSRAIQRAEKRGVSPEGGNAMQRRRPNNNNNGMPNHSRTGYSGPMRPNSYGAQSTSFSNSNNNVMMNLRQFLATQPETASEEEAMAKYKEYKQNFKRKRLQEFFVVHKNEEWFREKYFPDDKKARDRQRQAYLDKRCGLYTKLLDEGYFDRCKLDGTKEQEVLQVMDTVVVFLEGGTENDLQELGDGKLKHAEDELRKGAAVKEDGETNDDEGGKKPVAVDRKDGETTDDVASVNNTGKVNNNNNDDDGIGLGDDAASLSNADNSRGDVGSRKRSEEKSPVRNPRVDELEWKPRRNLSKTKSLFLRNVHPAATRLEIEKICRKYPGFIRLAVSEPMPERRFYRRAWATYRADVDINHYCWQLNKVKLRDQELGVIVNRELASRIREVEDYFKHKPMVRECMRMACRLIQLLDKQKGLWQHRRKQPNDADVAAAAAVNAAAAMADENAADDNAPSASGSEKQNQLPAQFLDDEYDQDGGMKNVEYETPHAENPVLRKALRIIQGSDDDDKEYESFNVDRLDDTRRHFNVKTSPNKTATDSADKSPESVDAGNNNASEVEYDLDDEWTQLLDELIWYLRVVHSVDFYAAKEYPIEDEMPYQLGIMYLRGSGKGPGDADKMKDSLTDLRKRLKQWAETSPVVPMSELLDCGLKSVSEEVEKFIKANTVSVGPEKYLCPLSNKKFKAPDFVRKHIINKHADKLQELKNEVVFFNNYLRDPTRPAPAENAASSSSNEASGGPSVSGQAFSNSGGGPSSGIQSRLGMPPQFHQQQMQQQQQGMMLQGMAAAGMNPMAAAAAGMMNPMVETFSNPMFVQQMAAAMATSMAAMMGGAMMGGNSNDAANNSSAAMRFGSQPGRRGGGYRRTYRDLDAPDEFGF